MTTNDTTLILNRSAIGAIATILHGLAWASWYEDEGGSLGGCKIEDHMPIVPAACWKVAACLWARAALDGFEPKRLADWQDVAHHFVGSGGGSGEYDLKKLPSGEYNYYTGDTGAVYVFCEFGGCNNEQVAGAQAPGWFPDTVNAVITYDIVDPSSTEDGEPTEYGFTDGKGDDHPTEGWEPNVRDDYDMNISPREAAALCAGRNVRAALFGEGAGEEIWSAEADAVQDQHTGCYRSETLHLRGTRAVLEMVKRLTNIK